MPAQNPFQSRRPPGFGAAAPTPPRSVGVGRVAPTGAMSGGLTPQRSVYGQQYGGMALPGMNRMGGGSASMGVSGNALGGVLGGGVLGAVTNAWSRLNNARGASGSGDPFAPWVGNPTVEDPNPYQPGTTEYDLWKAYKSVNGQNLIGASNEAFRQMIGAGMYNPGGSQSMIDALSGQARGDANALRQRSNTMSQLSGMDPAQAASSYFQRDMGSEGEVQRMLLNARLQSMTANQGRLQSLAGSGQDAQYQAWLRGFPQAQQRNP